MDAALQRLCEQVKAAAARQQTLRIRGGGTRAFFGNPWPPSATPEWLDTAGYRGIVSYEPWTCCCT